MANLLHCQHAETAQCGHQQGGNAKAGEQTRADAKAAQEGAAETGEQGFYCFHDENLSNLLFMGL
jgi:hypothetical protein